MTRKDTGTSGVFEPDNFFANMYQSPFQPQLENNILISAGRYREVKDREEFYVKVISTGAINYLYEAAWLVISKSQLSLLHKLDRKTIPIGVVKGFYDAAAARNRRESANCSFNQWFDFLLDRRFIVQQGDMIAITVQGRDFLRCLSSRGRSADSRREIYP